MLLAERKTWLPRERELLRSCGVIIDAPSDYADKREQYNLKFWNDRFIIDGVRIANADEVPFMIDWDTRQLVTKNERISLRPRELKYLKKHKFGTLFIFQGPTGPLFTMIIFQGVKGEGKIVNEELRELNGSHSSNVLYTANENGNVTSREWKWAIEALAQRTLVQRGCTKSPEQWQKVFVLYVDGYSVHVSKAAAREFYQRFGIVIRTLPVGSSHIMQPVDHNYGVLYKNIFRDMMLRFDAGIEMMAQFARKEIVNKKKWRELVIRIISDIVAMVCDCLGRARVSVWICSDLNKMWSDLNIVVVQMEQPQYLRLHLMSWVNCGFHLPADGSRDDDPNSIVVGHWHCLYNNPWPEELSTEALQQTFCKVVNAQGRLSVPVHDTRRPERIDWECLDDSEPKEFQDDPKVRAIMYALEQWNEKRVKEFNHRLQQDLTQRENPMPTNGFFLETTGVLALTTMFNEKYGESEGERVLFNDILGLPVFSRKGQIVTMPKTKGKWDWRGVPSGRRLCMRADTALQRITRSETLKSQQIGSRTTVSRHNVAAMVEEDVLFVVNVLHDGDVPMGFDDVRDLVYERSLRKRSRGSQADDRDIAAMNHARRNGSEIGYSLQGEERWYILFQVEVEQRMLDVTRPGAWPADAGKMTVRFVTMYPQ